MGCGCNKTTKEQNSVTTLARATNSIRKVWAKTQPEQPTHVIKRINKK
jgi:hypothetical protein|tara:strand:- start:799 stop:942 length:144 start_codon:yes stop_codon:yes gene_type:complete